MFELVDASESAEVSIIVKSEFALSHGFSTKSVYASGHSDLYHCGHSMTYA